MSTSTTRLALVKPDPNPTTGDDVDVSQLNDNADKLDAAVGWTICTSSTRPGSPWDGQPIYETDTNKFYSRVEGAWVQMKSGGDYVLPGAQSTVANTTTQTAIGTYTLPASEPAVATVSYRIKAWCRASVTGTPTLTIRARLGGTATTSNPIVITASSGVTDHPVVIEAVVTFSAVGAGTGVARAIVTVQEALSVAGSGPFTSVTRQDLPNSMTSLNTTAGTLVFDVTVQWSAASSSNTLTVNTLEVARIT